MLARRFVPLASNLSTQSENFSSPNEYFSFVKPGLKDHLELFGMDVIYHRGQGDRLYYADSAGKEVEILDLVGGYGACLLGHNHPEMHSVISDRIRYAQPFLVQGSNQAEAGRLAGRLSRETGRITGKSYVCTFGNSGAEAVDIAIKHSELERAVKVQAHLEKGKVNFRRLRDLHRKGRCSWDVSEWGNFSSLPQGKEPTSFEDILGLIEVRNRRVLGRPSLFLALEGAFHGKSVGSLSLTYNRAYSEPFLALLQPTRFLDPLNPNSLETTFEMSSEDYYDLTLDETARIRIIRKPVSNIAALFVEPIQGEGGILEISSDFLKEARRWCDAYNVPLIFDEIQSGMGRTGRFFASERLDVAGDIYLLSKSLGGGFAKISATLINRDRYLDEFSLIHSSTFAEDPLSCSVANKVLDIVERDRLLEMAEEKGSFLKAHFERLVRKYPGVLRPLRGKGLMLGVEFCGQSDSSSALIREIEKAGRLAYFVAGYLFHQEKMRVLPTLSNPHVLRLEPSAYISYSDLIRVSDAFDRLGEVLAKSNAHALLHYVGGNRSPVVFPVRDYSREQKSKPIETPHSKVGFLAHFIDESQLKELDPSFEAFSSQEQDRFIRKIMAMAKPIHIASEEITSRTGEKISFNLIALPITSSHMVEFLRSPKNSRAMGMVKEGVRMAYEMGCEVLGLGQYTSIISNNGLALTEPGLPLTTGNSYTVSVSVQSVLRAAELVGVDASRVTLSLVGAAGNIGTAYALMIANRFPRIHLVGSPKQGSLERLQIVRSNMIQESYRRLVQHGASLDMLEGIGKPLLEIPQVERLLDAKADEQTALNVLHRSGLLDDIISISTDLSSIRRSEIIVAVSNSDTRLIQTEWVKPNVIICDVSVPCAASHELTQNRKDVFYFTGGIVRLPHEEEFDLPGTPLPPGHVFACMAETMILGLSGIRENFSYGKLKVRQIELIESLASHHGFGLSALKPYSPSQWAIFTDQKKIDKDWGGSHG